MKHQNTYWMPLHTGEFLAETAHLNALQIGAYTLLLIHYWHKRGIPADDRQLARIARLTTRGWQHTKPFIAPLFTEQWTHTRIDEEIVKRDIIHHKRAASGSKGGHNTALNYVMANHTKRPLTSGPCESITTRTNLLKRWTPH
jgi:uncharacterized protein YdaU (DUF1376 family)